MHFSSTFTVFLPINDNRDSHATQNWQWIFPTSIVVVSVGNWQNSSDDFIDVFDNHWIRTFGLFSWGRGRGVCPFRNHPQACKEGQVSHMYFPFTTPPYKYSGLCVYHLQSKLPIYTPSHLVLLPQCRAWRFMTRESDFSTFILSMYKTEPNAGSLEPLEETA